MDVQDFGKCNGQDYHPTPPYGVLDAQKKDKQQDSPFPTAGSFMDSQDLMNGPQYHPLETSPSRKGFLQKNGVTPEVPMQSEGRFHQV
jgi:hypothetical protein